MNKSPFCSEPLVSANVKTNLNSVRSFVQTQSLIKCFVFNENKVRTRLWLIDNENNGRFLSCARMHDHFVLHIEHSFTSVLVNEITKYMNSHKIKIFVLAWWFISSASTKMTRNELTALSSSEKSVIKPFCFVWFMFVEPFPLVFFS